eukprot:5493494-Pleurochrysis_carterae.AAC.1
MRASQPIRERGQLTHVHIWSKAFTRSFHESVCVGAQLNACERSCTGDEISSKDARLNIARRKQVDQRCGRRILQALGLAAGG